MRVSVRDVADWRRQLRRPMVPGVPSQGRWTQAAPPRGSSNSTTTTTTTPHPLHHHPTTAAVVIIDRSPARSTTSPVAVCKLTPSQEQQRVTVVGTQGQISVADRNKTRVCGPKRRLNLDGGTTAGGGGGSGAGSQQLQPTEAKMSKRTFYGNDVVVRPLLQTSAMPPAKPMRSMPIARRGKKEPECLTISISSDEEADADGTSEECYQRVSSETPTKENHPAPPAG
ncbi:hypothetical protein MTO96_015074 [Rhipicephalus appendiculatus]